MSLDDEQLRAAFATLEGRDADPIDAERVWAAVAGELSAEETAVLVDRAAEDPALAHAWRLARELGAAPVQRKTRWRTWAVGLALAAMALLAVRAAVVDPGPDDPAEFRDGPTVTLASALPDGAALDRLDCTLRWTGAPAGSRYAVQVTAEDMTLLDRARDLETASYTVPAEKLLGLEGGDRLMWQVDAVLPNGHTVRSASFVHPLR